MTSHPAADSLPSPRIGHFTASDGGRLAVQISGQGPALILLHEWAGEHGLWRPFLATLTRHFTVYAWDARGHGRLQSGQGGGPPVLPRMAADLTEMVRAFGLVRPLVAGHSMGALTLWQAILTQGSDWLGGVVILDQSPKLVTDPDWSLGIYGDFSAARNQQFLQALQQDFAETVLGLVGNGLNLRAREQIAANSEGIRRLRQRLQAMDPAPLVACWASLAAADLRPALSRITVPALLIYGGDSHYYSQAVAEWVAQAISGAELLVYPTADHAPHQTDRARFVTDLLDFAHRRLPG